MLLVIQVVIRVLYFSADWIIPLPCDFVFLLEGNDDAGCFIDISKHENAKKGGNDCKIPK